MNNQNDILVSVCCITYNHAPYIRQCLDGFLMQKTDFRFEIIIHDDCSTDGTKDVVKEYANKYPELIVPIIQEVNQYQSGNKRILASFVYPKARGKYIALCEGDDYWIHPKKLQMQVDFLESHDDYGMVHTDFNLTKGLRRHFKEIPNEDGNWFPRILTEGLPIGTVTVLFRKSVYDAIPKLYNDRGWPMGDYPLWIELAHEAKVKYIPVVTSIYRVLEDSASHSKDIGRMIAFKNASVEICLFYANSFGVKLENNGYTAGYYQDIIRYACRLNEKKVATDYYCQAKSQKLLSRKAKLFYIATKFPIIKSLVELFVKV